MRQYSNGHTGAFAALRLIATLEDLPAQPALTSERIKALLSRALTQPEGLAPDEVREMAAAVVYHLLSERARLGRL